MRIFQINHHSLASSRLFHLRVLTFLPRHSEFFHVHLSILRKMPPSKTLMDFFPMPNAKRPKTNFFTSSGSEKSACTAGEAIDSVPSSSTNTNNDGFRDSTASLTLSVATGSSLTVDERAKIEFKKSVAQSKRNAKICLQKLAHAKGEAGRGYVLLEELLVEETWLNVLSGELQKPCAKNLCKFVEKEICSGTTQIYPPSHLIFNALNSTPYDKVKVVILGQDPYHGPGQATGLCFSVPEGVKIPSSLVNIFKEIKNDLGCAIPSHGNLEKWALQGVLLLNTVLTVRSHQANSHAKKGWEQFTDAVIQTISQNKSGVVFLLWGNSAQAKSRFIDMSKHHILKAAHPSGLSANRGFFGCRHFSRTNKILEEGGEVPIDWQL